MYIVHVVLHFKNDECALHVHDIRDITLLRQRIVLCEGLCGAFRIKNVHHAVQGLIQDFS